MKKAWMMGLVVLMSLVFSGVALAGNETGDNTYFGEGAGNDGGGTYNSSFGYYAGDSLTTDGDRNTFMGYYAGRFNTTGLANSFMGYYAGYSNSTGYDNSFIGGAAGYSNSTGYDNSFIGGAAGYHNTSGYDNSFMGFYAGHSNHTGYDNTFIGVSAGYNLVDDKGNTTENHNTLIGSYTNIDYDQTAGTINNATAIGYRAFVAQANSLILGSIKDVNDATASVNVGIGTSVPARQLHIVGEQAVFRMDRPADTAAFMLVRTDVSGNPLKTFVVGANASGSNNGSFVINDLGTGVSGAGTRRLTIDNNGNATFTNSVYALSFVPTSSIAYKTNVKTYENALEKVKKLRGVSFEWKESGNPSVGLIAEEVDKVIPEVVAHDGQTATGLNYDSLVGVLVEAVKEQEARHQAQLQEQQGLIQEQQKSIAALSQKVSELERLLILSNAVSKVD